MARALSIVLFAAFYAVIVVWARGLDAFKTHSALLALAFVFVAVCVAALFVGGSLSPGEREDRGNRWVLPVFAVVSLATAIIPPFDDAHGFATFGGEGVRWLGVRCLLWAGRCGCGRWRCSEIVSAGWSPSSRATGCKRPAFTAMIRHPSYLGLLVSSFGWALAFRSGLGLAAAACLIPPLLARIRAEENLLASQFGAEYDAYRARTARLIPGVW